MIATSVMRRFAGLMSIPLIILFCSACQSTVDTVDAHLTELNASSDNFRNQAILLNILRAQQSAPLSFVNVLSIPTQYNANINTALPTFEVGPLKVQSGRPFGFGNNTLGASFQNQASPTFNNLTGRDFTQAATTAISPIQLLRLTRDGFSTDLILSLTVSKITIKANSGYYAVDTHPMKKVECPRIEKLSPYQMISGAECLWLFRKRGALLGIDFQSKQKSTYFKGSVSAGNFTSDKSTLEYNVEPDAEFCFNIPRQLKDSDLSKLGAIESKGKRCGPSTVANGIDWLGAEFKSLVGIYRFLGEYLRNPIIQSYYTEVDGSTDEPLLTILTDTSNKCFVSVDYLGVNYCVPANGALRTKAVFAILDQLQNNNTDTSKIPQPSVVTLTGQIR